MGRCAERARHGTRERISPSFKLHYPVHISVIRDYVEVFTLRFHWGVTARLHRERIDSSSRSTSLEPRRHLSSALHCSSGELFSPRKGRVKTPPLPTAPSAVRRLSKNKNRPLGYVNMADENLLSRSRSAAASRPHVTPGNKERAAF